MREIDRRIRFPNQTLGSRRRRRSRSARSHGPDFFFGATVGLLRGDGREQTVKNRRRR